MNSWLKQCVLPWCMCLSAGLSAQAGSMRETGTCIRAWQVVGPFEAVGIETRAVDDEANLSPTDVPFVDGKAWKQITAEQDVIDLETPEAFGSVNKVIGYAYAELNVERACDLILGVGSDDAVSAWWNGRRVLVNEVYRGVTVSEDKIILHADKGPNRLLLKIYDEGGGYGFSADVQSADDEPVAWTSVKPLNEDELLDLIEKRSFLFFWNEVNPENGLIADTAPEEGADPSLPCSVASIGFGLTGICIADSRGWISREEALARVITTLETMYNDVENVEGFYYHFITMKDGERQWDCELSSIDTALFLAGALTCRAYFDDPEVRRLADALYARVNWPWMLNGKDTLSMGWSPEHGFIKHHWDTYSEHMVMCLLAIGSPTHPLDPECWHAWSRPTYSYNGMIYLQAVPLFLHQYSHGWVDFRDKRDAHADYFLNTALATRAHRDYCLSLNEQFPLYSENLWGVTASKGPEKYMVWGGPPPTMEYPIDGTIVPCSAGGSIAFDPEITIPVMQQVYTRHYRLGWGKYGLIDAFNPHTGWSAASYIGIDVGATMIAIENLRTGNVWKWFMENPEIRRAMIMSGFHSTARDLDPADEAYLEGLARDTWAGIQALVHPESGLPWETSEQLPETSLGAVGLYLADIAAASGMELISAEEGAALAAGVITRLQQQAAWNGFFSSRLEVAAGKAVEGAVIATVENGILAAGLITVAAAFPALRESCNALLEAMDWNALYDPESGLLYGGVEPGVGAPVGQWRVDLLGSDGRLAVLMAIASGRAPVQVWDRLNRDLMTSYEVRYLTPGTEGGGMYMQYLPGIFLFEENTFMGRSAANYAYANLEQARLASQDVWGVSACLSPEGGFLGWGALTESIVAPHASALALATYPREVVANLKALEEHGVRAPLPDGDNAHAYGFRDSLDVTSGQVADAYRFADQSMILLSLANFLRDDMIRTLVASCDKVRQAQARIPDYASPEGGPNVSVFMPGIGANVPVPQKIRVMDVPFMVTPPVMDGDFSTWEVVGATGKEHIQFPSHAESGAPPAGFGLKAAFALAWDQDYLYLGINVLEDELVMEQPADELYKDDAVELFVDPACDGFSWGNESDYQIGFSILPDHVGVQSYAWFQKTVPPGVKAAATTGEVDAGAVYTIEAAVPWSFLNMPNPEPGDEFCGTIAVHTVDAVREATAKINWSYVTEVDKGRLGRLRLVGGPPARH